MTFRFVPRHVRIAAGVVIGLILAQSAAAQRQTIREALANANAPVDRVSTIPSGMPPSIDRILAETDVIVVGLLGSPRSYASPDERDVWTDFELLDPVELGSRRPRKLAAARGPLTVTFLGGTLRVNGLTFTSKHQALPIPDEGTRCLLLLKETSTGYEIAASYYGVFAIENGTLRPLTEKRGFAPELRGAVADAAAMELTRRLENVAAVR